MRHERVRVRGGVEANRAAARVLLAARPTGQCASVLATRSGATFCAKPAGHGGDHRGTGAQWHADGRRVPVTERAP